MDLEVPYFQTNLNGLNGIENLKRDGGMKYTYSERPMKTWNTKRTIDTLDSHQVRVHNGLIEMLLSPTISQQKAYPVGNSRMIQYFTSWQCPEARLADVPGSQRALGRMPKGPCCPCPLIHVWHYVGMGLAVVVPELGSKNARKGSLESKIGQYRVERFRI